MALQPLDATTTLFFGHVVARAGGQIRIMQHGDAEMAGALSTASAIILVRGLFEFDGVVRCARALGTPLYYFADDNFMVLRQQGGRDAEFFERYSLENVREALRQFSGVLLASPALGEYFRDQRLHARLLPYPPVADDTQAGPGPEVNDRRIAFFGGRHLHESFLDRIVPAVRRFAAQQATTLIAVGITEPVSPSEGLSVIREPYEPSYARGITKLAEHGVDILVHPVAARLANNKFKNPHALISANSLGAVLVISNQAPYDGLHGEGVALLCEDSEEAWCQQIQRAADRTVAAAVRPRLAAFCAEHFSGRPNLDVIGQLLREHAPPARLSVPWRRAVSTVILSMNRAGRALSRAARIVRPASAGAA